VKVTQAGVIRVGPDHPSLPGHFPGAPVVPGVVLLEAALARVLDDLPEREGRPPVLAAVMMAKFLRVVLPGEEIAVAYELAGDDRVRFVASRAGEAVLRGTARVGV